MTDETEHSKGALNGYALELALHVLTDFTNPAEQMMIVEVVVCNVILNLSVPDCRKMDVIEILAAKCRPLLRNALAAKAKEMN